MVDCGVMENFIDKEYTEWNRIPLNEKMVPQRVLAMDGQEVVSGPVTHDTVVKLKINNHHKTITLHCITIGNLPIIVRLPWLKRHNPNIDWKEGRVTFDSTGYAREYLDTSPHATTVAEERAIGQYYQDTVPDMTVMARYLQVYDLRFYDKSLSRNYGSLRVRILRPHRSSLVFPIRQLYEPHPLRFSATLDALDSNMGPYPCR
jgi:hypothetical protein